MQRLANGYWLIRAPTGDPVGPRVDPLGVVKDACIGTGNVSRYGKAALRAKGK